ncbi:MAG TPA: pyridoxal-phosphate dependent enzyme [Streptosporangiaceae bacterium]|jgi:1-aminocyclopropane-1-carboxylate deaminase
MSPGTQVSVTPVRPLELCLPSPLQEVVDDRLAAGIRLFLKRDDLINPHIGGNKWRKLQPNVAAARAAGHDRLLTFGGAYSNHIRATAAAGHYFGFSTIGVIRGEEHLPLNPSLAQAASYGMTLTYLDRSSYREKKDPHVIDRLHDEFGEFYLLPEGGSNAQGVRGCAAIPAEITDPLDIICCPCGTGTTLAGIASALRPGQHAIGFSALNGGGFLTAEVEALQSQAFGFRAGDWHIECGYHFGGFARRTPALDEFIAGFRTRHGLTLNWVYAAKMMYGIYALAGQPPIPPGSTVTAVITG